MKEEADSPFLKDLKLDHDGFFQETFRLKRIARAFLKKVLPKEAIRRLDLKHLSVEDRHLTDEMFKKREADVVYRVPIKGTKEHIDFLIIVEHKSDSDLLTLFQLWGYVYLACRQAVLATPEKDREKVGYRLPPIVAIIIHHGKSKFRGKTELSELFYSLPGLKDHYPELRAILFDLNVIDDDDPVLSDPEVPELKVVLMVMKTVLRKDVAFKIKDVLDALKPHSDDPEIRRLIRTIWVYLANNAKHLRRNLQALLGTFQEVVGGNIMSTMVEIWTAEGKAEKAAEDVLRILTRQRGAVPESLAERVRAITDIEKLDELFDLAFDCKTLDEFAQHLP